MKVSARLGEKLAIEQLTETLNVNIFELEGMGQPSISNVRWRRYPSALNSKIELEQTTFWRSLNTWTERLPGRCLPFTERCVLVIHHQLEPANTNMARGTKQLPSIFSTELFRATDHNAGERALTVRKVRLVLMRLEIDGDPIFIGPYQRQKAGYSECSGCQ